MMQKTIDPYKICKKCREISRDLKISYNDMYKKIGISQSVFFNIEKKYADPKGRTINKLLNFIAIHELHEARRDNQDQ